MREPLTMLNDAMLLQCTAQIQALSPALCFSILKKPVNQLAARKRAMICNTMLFSQLQDGVLVCYKTADKDMKAQRAHQLEKKLNSPKLLIFKSKRF